MQRWNINYLKELYDKYYKLSFETKDPTLSLEYESTANSILGVIERYDELVHKPRTQSVSIDIFSYRDVIDNDKDLIMRYGYSFPCIRDFNEYNGRLDINPQNLTRINTTVNKVLQVSRGFYDQFDSRFRDTYIKMSRNFRNTLHFYKLTPGVKEFGQTYSIYKTDITFFELGYCNSAQDYISAIHEFGHGISCSLNQEAMWDYEKYCLIEVDSLFFELLGLDYIGQTLNCQQDSFTINLEVLEDYLYSAKLICTKLDMYDALTYKELKNKRKIKKYLATESDYDKKGIEDVINTQMRELMHYIVSYLTAVELYLIYQESPETALDLLFEIINHSERSNQKYLEYIRSLGLEPGKNFDRYLEVLMNKAKDLKDEKSLRYKN